MKTVMKTVINTAQKDVHDNIEPMLRKVLNEAMEEHRELNGMFDLMGWGQLPDTLKMEIKDDVAAMVKELKGQYSSCDPHVKRRRNRVVYWVEMFLEGVCSEQTAVDALRVRPL